MHVERLKRLSALLRRDAADPNGVKFDLEHWASPYGAAGHWTDPEGQPKVDCGTTACALGLAAISGEFKEDGLTWTIEYALEPAYEGVRGFAAGAALFDIEVYQAHYLFDPAQYYDVPRGAQGELLVAARIDDFIATDGRSAEWKEEFADDEEDEEFADDE